MMLISHSITHYRSAAEQKTSLCGEAHPSRVQLHDDGEGAVGGEDDVVDHACVVADPHRALPLRHARSQVTTH